MKLKHRLPSPMGRPLTPEELQVAAKMVKAAWDSWKQMIDTLVPPLVKLYQDSTQPCPRCRGKSRPRRCRICDGAGLVWKIGQEEVRP